MGSCRFGCVPGSGLEQAGEAVCRVSTPLFWIHDTFPGLEGVMAMVTQDKSVRPEGFGGIARVLFRSGGLFLKCSRAV